ncbi:hypothetical protein ACIBIZ_25045 [Nonomuraea spiralis]|uniref:hypothetical protein n=1 Tax=Nonomuraea spiralis TaxID=46182 RepID=UPI0037A3D603
MGWTLETPEGERIDVNAWNWRPTLALLEGARVLDPALDYSATASWLRDFCHAAPHGFTCA